jgi:AraC-like DNA-binding protein
MTLTSRAAGTAPGGFRTSDLGAASHILERFYVPHDMRVTSRKRFELDSTLVRAANVRVGLLTFGTDVSVDCQAETRSFVLAYATTGSVEITSGRRSVTVAPSQATLLSVGDASRFDFPEHASLVTMSFDRADLEAELSAMLGHRTLQPIVFDLAVDVGSGPGPSLLRTLELFREQATSAGALGVRHPAFAASLARATLRALLLSAAHNYSDDLERRSDALEMPAAIAKAVQAVEENPMAIHRAGDLGRIAGLSLRALEAGFERHVGASPMIYVRRVRLDRAREQLLFGDSHRLTVSQVASRWGFFHLGRFSATYRQSFGENPSATLLRPASGSSRR